MLQNSIVPSSNSFSPERVALIKRTIAVGASDDELALFIAQCQRTGLDPFSRQIYSIQRQVFDPKLNRKVSKMITQVSIDGLRLIAERSGLYAGQYGPFFCGLSANKAHQANPDFMGNQDKGTELSGWTDIWTSRDYPFAAKVGVVRKDFAQPLYAVAYWSEYCPMYDGKPAQMWTRFPTLMLAKCAEALALRRAFPQELSDLFMFEETERSGTVLPKGSTVLPEEVEELQPSEKSSADLIDIQQDIRSSIPAEEDIVDESQAEEDRPYSPLRLQALLAEVAARSGPASPEIIDRVINLLQAQIKDPDEFAEVAYFLAGSRYLYRAPLRTVTAIDRWLKFDDLSRPSPLALEELASVREHLSNQ